jgi:hypothetical protein
MGLDKVGKMTTNKNLALSGLPLFWAHYAIFENEQVTFVAL